MKQESPKLNCQEDKSLNSSVFAKTSLLLNKVIPTFGSQIDVVFCLISYLILCAVCCGLIDFSHSLLCLNLAIMKWAEQAQLQLNLSEFI